MRKILLFMLVLAAALGQTHSLGSAGVSSGVALAQPRQMTSEQILAAAFKQHRSNIQVAAQGQVIRLLRDDVQGSRHQRFIIRLSSGQTLLIAHNIDLAPRIRDLRQGDAIAVYGEYEWSDQGGVIHWTHRDPKRRHIDGWIEHNRRRYQ